MKILIPVLVFGRSGGARVLSKFASEWIRAGCQVSFLAPTSSPDPYFPTAARILWATDKGEIHEAPPAIRHKSSARYNLLALYRGLQRVGRNYDVILANQSLTAWPVTFARCGVASKFYYVQAYEPGFYLDSFSVRNSLLALLSAATYHFPLKKVVNAPIYFRYKNLRAAAFVPPGLDLDIYRPRQERRLSDTDEIVIGCIGRREPIKGTQYVLTAFERLAAQDHRVRLRVAYGNLPSGWNHERCEVVVPTNDSELAEYYRSIDIMVAPGTSQHGAPHYPVLEAAACGVPVVTTGYLGASENTAWLVSNKDPQSIVAAVTACISQDRLREERVTAFIKEVAQYSWPAVAGRMLALLQEQQQRRVPAWPSQ